MIVHGSSLKLQENIKKYRKLFGCSIRELGRKSGISYNHISTLETGRCNPTLKVLIAFALCFETTVSELIGEELMYEPSCTKENNIK